MCVSTSSNPLAVVAARLAKRAVDETGLPYRQKNGKNRQKHPLRASGASAVEPGDGYPGERRRHERKTAPPPKLAEQEVRGDAAALRLSYFVDPSNALTLLMRVVQRAATIDDETTKRQRHLWMTLDKFV
ncbi:hypothetical protein [Lysobacter sp. yr284]|uniref:hypothetical protein n=1 Tax=Lysobacter sp. yr284 TaxID=1761791 RepID=UPI001113B0FF|nr:hypothetical protein [Lysobacter sp. yr284]